MPEIIKVRPTTNAAKRKGARPSKGKVLFMSLSTSGNDILQGYTNHKGSKVIFNHKPGQEVYGIPIFLADGRTPLGSVQFKGRRFELSEDDTEAVKALREHPGCANGPYGNPGRGIFIEIKPEEERKNRENRLQNIQQATSFAVNCNDLDAHIALASINRHARRDEAKGMLGEIAISTPEVVLSMFNVAGKNKIANLNPDTEARGAFVLGQKYRQIVGQNDGLYFNGVNLGTSANSAAAILLDKGGQLLTELKQNLIDE